MKKKKIKLITAFIVILSFLIPQAAFCSDGPTVAVVTSNNCSTCNQIKPIIKELEDNYGTQVEFVTFNLSSRGSLEEARQLASEKGLASFLEEHKATVPTVGILCPGGKVEKLFVGETNSQIYKDALNEILLNMSNLCSL